MTCDLKRLRMVVFKEARACARWFLCLRGRIVLVKSFSCIWKAGEIIVVSFRVCMVYPSCKILSLFNYIMELNWTLYHWNDNRLSTFFASAWKLVVVSKNQFPFKRLRKRFWNLSSRDIKDWTVQLQLWKQYAIFGSVYI